MLKIFKTSLRYIMQFKNTGKNSGRKVIQIVINFDVCFLFRLETTKLLLENGADPFAKSRYGDDALQTACLKGAHQIFDYLKSRINYSAERLADSHELIGSTFLDDHNETRVAILHWRMAHHIRLKDAPYIRGLKDVICK